MYREDMRTQGRGGWVGWGALEDQGWYICTTMCKIASQWEPAIQHRTLSSLLAGDLGGWERGVGERFTCIHIADILQLIHFIVQQKLTQPCKAIIFQLKKNAGENHKRQIGKKKERKMSHNSSQTCNCLMIPSVLLYLCPFKHNYFLDIFSH